MMRSASLALLGLLLAAPATAQLISGQAATPDPAVSSVAVPAAGPGMLARDVAVLQVLDKVSARTTRLRVPVGSSAAFGLIVITARSCQISPPSAAPEAAAFLEVSEVDINKLPRAGGTAAILQAQAEKLLFSGWMFASSPALSALEHPTYDVTVTGCETRVPTAAERAAGGEEGAATPSQSAAESGSATSGATAPSAEADPAPVD